MAQMPPEASALALRGDWSYGKNPLPNMVSLAESHGIRVFCLPSVGKEVDAFSFVFDGQPYIAVDAHKTPERVRFDIFIRQLYDGRFRRTGDG
ncbi:ImmA/IrrE family metallo-endopeptidase [Bifidobacterium dentium]|uniref:ImmA/IrrE family metallo-endopeptidase n=1 Tax=Bifidobacterium dentium TaxID=1689 RepID=UPI0022E1BBF0|nr:ImmA/IrrE family metallo-endopeptidase [Bifidobacterium dentium]